jgi:hypothetical protein
VAAAKTISCAGSNGAFVCLCTGINTNLIGDGVLANVSLTLAPAATGQVPVGLAVLLSASLAADAIATIGSGGNIAVFSRFDLNHDGKVDLLDLQLLIQQILSGSTAASDFNADGASNILDVQLLVRGALP